MSPPEPTTETPKKMRETNRRLQQRVLKTKFATTCQERHCTRKVAGYVIRTITVNKKRIEVSVGLCDNYQHVRV